MWGVSNSTILPILNRYRFLIESIFDILINVSYIVDKENIIKDDNYLDQIFDKSMYLDKRLLNINISNDDRFRTLVNEIILIDPEVLVKQRQLYQTQNEQIANGNYNIRQHEHPNSLKKLFKDYFYTQFFGISWIWEELIGQTYNRSMFKSKFIEENYLYVCSYCDVDTISSSRNSWIEHFLPKSKFPFLSCNPFNLIPSCTSCNVAGTGKGENTKVPINTQYNLQIGNYVLFKLENGEIVIPPNENESIENFLKLLKLRERYQENTVKNRVFSTLRANYGISTSAKNMGEFDEDSFFDYIRTNGKNNGLYFSQKCLLNYIDEI